MSKPRTDDKSIENHHRLIRGISQALIDKTKGFEEQEAPCPTSNMFKFDLDDDSEASMSVILEEELKTASRTLDDIDKYWVGLLGLKADNVRDRDLGICRSPTGIEPAHGDVFDKAYRSRSKLKRLQKEIAEMAEWLKVPRHTGSA